MARDSLFAVAGGFVSALLMMSLASGYPGALVLLYLAQLPIFLVGLSLGLKAGAIAVTAAIATATVLGGLRAGAFYAVAFALPALLVIRHAVLARAGAGGAKEWYPPGLLLCWLSGFGALALVVTAGAFASMEGGLEGQIRITLPVVLEQFWGTAGDPTARARLEALARYMPAIFVTSWLLFTVLNAIAGQAVLAASGRNLRPSPAMADIEVPIAALWALALAAVGTIVLPDGLGYLAANLVPVLALPYMFLGLSVVHALTRPSAQRVLWLVGFYTAFMMLNMADFIGMFLVTALGIAESWFNIRRRLTGGSV